MGVRIALATIALALVCAAPARAVETGINETLGHTKPLPRTADELGADWVRIWAVAEDYQARGGGFDEARIAALNSRVATLKGRGIKVLVVVLGRTAPDPAAFGAFMGRFAGRVHAVDAWEVWNEPDSGNFWPGGPDPAAYAALLRAAYPAIKAAQPTDVVVTGGMVGNNMDFLAALYDHGAGGHFDAVGVHTDTACLTSGPDSYYRDERGRVGRYTFSAYREVHAVMADHGDAAKQVWMTELGWNTQRGLCNTGEKAGKKRLGVSPRRQARLLRAAYRCVAADAFVGVALWFGLQDIKGGARHARGFGLYKRSGKAKPAARAFRRLERGIRPRRGCGGYVDRTPPTIQVREPLDGARFRGKLSVRVRAFDNRGGSGIGRISMALNGDHVRSWGGSGGSIDPWWGSADWRPGIHTLTFSVRDRAQNPTSVSVRVQKLGRRR